MSTSSRTGGDSTAPGIRNQEPYPDPPPIPRLQELAGEPVFPFSRPYSLPESQSGSSPETFLSPPPVIGSWPDRISCPSLALPAQTPYFTLAGSPPELAHEQGASGLSPRPPPVRAETDMMTDGRCPPALPYLTSSMQRSVPSSPLFGPSTATAMRPLSDGGLQRRMELEPEPPTILTPPPPPEADGVSHAPHEPFLSHAPPPEDSWIAIETEPSEYKLIIRLPGYDRDAM
jgi:hypothetical protein